MRREHDRLGALLHPKSHRDGTTGGFSGALFRYRFAFPLAREKDDTRFTPPGGGVEVGETALEALHREFMEEVQFVPKEIKLLGSLEVINPGAEEEIQKHNLQVRFVCKLGKLDHFIPLKDNETEQRIFVHYKDLPEYIGFINKYTSGKVQYDMYCDFVEGKINL